MSARRHASTCSRLEIGREGLHRPAVEHLALDGPALDHPPLVVAEPVEARREQDPDRRRDLHAPQVSRADPVPVLLAQEPVVHEHPQHLLDEEGVALRRGLDPGAGLGQRRPPEEVVDEALRLRLGQRLEEDRRGVELPSAPGRAQVEELGAREADEEDGRVPRPVGDVLDEVEERRLAPVDVVEDDHDRPPAREDLEQVPHGPEALLGRADLASEADEPRHELGDDRGVVVALEPGGDEGANALGVVPGEPGGLEDDLAHRPERDPLPVGEAAPLEDGRPVADLGEDLGHEARLAHPRGPEDGEEVAGALPHSASERVGEEHPLAAAADDRRLEPRRVPGRVRMNLEQPVGGDRLVLALHGQRLERLHDDGVAGEAVRHLADEDLAGRGRLLEALGDVDRLARHEALGTARVAGDHLTAGHSRAHGDAHAEVALELFVELGQRVAELDDRPQRAQRVVLVDDRRAEDGHDRVADELLHRPAVALEDRPHAREVAIHDPAQLLGVVALAHAGPVGHVREDDRDGLAHARARRLRRREGRAAGWTEPGPLVGRLAAPGACGHGSSVATASAEDKAVEGGHDSDRDMEESSI